jgi:N-acetylmuramoyl-L-alanine amidase
LYHKDAPDINGKNLALIMERKFDAYQKDEKYSKSEKRDLSVLRTTNAKKIPSVLWEVGFMNHPDGHKRLTNSDLMDKYADMMCESIIEYFDKYKK